MEKIIDLKLYWCNGLPCVGHLITLQTQGIECKSKNIAIEKIEKNSRFIKYARENNALLVLIKVENYRVLEINIYMLYN